MYFAQDTLPVNDEATPVVRARVQHVDIACAGCADQFRSAKAHFAMQRLPADAGIVSVQTDICPPKHGKGAADAAGEARHLGSSLLFPSENVRAESVIARGAGMERDVTVATSLVRV